MTGIGLVFPAHAPVRELPEFAERAEQLGYESVFVIEDCFLSGSVVMATAALQATERLRVGIGLMPVPLRSPALAAMEIATLANMFPDRLTVAFGHGVEAWMVQIGARPRNRVTALEETVLSIRRLLHGDKVSSVGEHVQFENVALDCPPDVAPAILVGTTGTKSIRVARRSADGLLFPEGCGPAFLREALHDSRESPSRPQHVAAYAWLSLEDTFEDVRAPLGPKVEDWLTNGLYPGPVRAALGSTGASAETWSDELGRQIAVCGTPNDCLEAIQALSTAGADEILLSPIGPLADRQIERFAAEVLPALTPSPEGTI